MNVNFKEEKDILSNLKHVIGNVDHADTSDNGYICHIYSGVARSYNGFTRSTLRLYPWADFQSSPNRALGGIEIREGKDSAGNTKKIIGMFVQKYDGFASRNDDSNELRLEWFQEAMIKITEIPNIKSIALPLQLSDDILDVAWTEYIKFINNFAAKYPEITIKLFRRTEQ